MLLDEFLKEHRKVEKQQATIAELKSNSAQQQKQIEALTAVLQKVSDQVRLCGVTDLLATRWAHACSIQAGASAPGTDRRVTACRTSPCFGTFCRPHRFHPR